jgi:hypothetical protein
LQDLNGRCGAVKIGIEVRCTVIRYDLKVCRKFVLRSLEKIVIAKEADSRYRRK